MVGVVGRGVGSEDGVTKYVLAVSTEVGLTVVVETRVWCPDFGDWCRRASFVGARGRSETRGGDWGTRDRSREDPGLRTESLLTPTPRAHENLSTSSNPHFITPTPRPSRLPLGTQLSDVPTDNERRDETSGGEECVGVHTMSTTGDPTKVSRVHVGCLYHTLVVSWKHVLVVGTVRAGHDDRRWTRGETPAKSVSSRCVTPYSTRVKGGRTGSFSHCSDPGKQGTTKVQTSTQGPPGTLVPVSEFGYTHHLCS